MTSCTRPAIAASTRSSTHSGRRVFKDPRVPWDTIKTTCGAIQSGQDGRTPFFRQKKYVGLGADMPLVKGTGDADAARGGGAPEQRRRRCDDAHQPAARVLQHDCQPAAAADGDDGGRGVADPQKERGAVVWLETRRFWDLRRWNAEPAPIKNTFLDSRDKCIPISENERLSNPNVR